MPKRILDESPQDSDDAERALRVTKAAIAPTILAGAAIAVGTAIPVLPAVAAIAALITEELWLPHLRMRKDSIVNAVASKVQHIDKAVLDSPAFIDALSAGVQAAVKTSSVTKRTALRNAIVNSISPTAPDLVKQQQFFALTDRYSELHLMLLDLFAKDGPSSSTWHRREWADPQSPLRQHAGPIHSAAKMAEKVFHQHHIDFIRHVWAQLIADGLVRAPLDNGGEGDIARLQRTTPLGEEYLAFIRE